VITVCAKEIENFWDFFNGKPKTFYTESKNRFLLQIFFKSALSYLMFLKEIDKRTDVVERELHKSMKNEQLIKLLNLEKGLVFYTTSLRSNELVMERLDRIKAMKMTEDEKDILDDVIIENKQAIEMANIYSNILSGMMDAFASVISNNLNQVVKLLTSVTIILMIPTLVTSLFSMNVKLPFQESIQAFVTIIVISFILSALGVLIFLKKKWF
jgi:magnesium transporter